MCDTSRRGVRDAFCYLHACVTLREPTTRAVLYTSANVSRNLERTDQNDGFKMSALESVMQDNSA